MVMEGSFGLEPLQEEEMGTQHAPFISESHVEERLQYDYRAKQTNNNKHKDGKDNRHSSLDSTTIQTTYSLLRLTGLRTHQEVQLSVIFCSSLARLSICS